MINNKNIKLNTQTLTNQKQQQQNPPLDFLTDSLSTRDFNPRTTPKKSPLRSPKSPSTKGIQPYESKLLQDATYIRNVLKDPQTIQRRKFLKFYKFLAIYIITIIIVFWMMQYRLTVRFVYF